MKKGATALDVTIEDRGYATPCHIFGGYVDPNTGYGKTWHPLRKQHSTAHRVAWEVKHGLLPDGQEPDHLCRVRACVNDSHLEPVTRRENARRGLTGAHLRKLNDAQVAEIAQSDARRIDLAERFGVSVRRIYQIRSAA